jgi:hypothetical protein
LHPQRRRGPLVALVLLSLTGVGIAVGVSQSTETGALASAPATITVVFTEEVVTDAYCSDFAETGYDDIPYHDAELFDGSGRLLGHGSLDGGTDTDSSCIFHATFSADRSTDGKYRLTVGNVNRGFLNYDESDLDDGTLYAQGYLE